VTKKITALWDVTPCNLVDIYTDISEGYVASIIRLEKRVNENPCAIIVEARCFSETSVHIGQTVYRHLSEGSYVPALHILL
jgi:hypothetical protein